MNTRIGRLAGSLADILTDLSGLHDKLEREIMGTPTGPDREMLTDANIHLMVARDRLTEVQRLLVGV